MVLLFLKIKAKPQSHYVIMCCIFATNILEMIIHVLTSSMLLGDQKATQDWALIVAVCKHLQSQVVEIHTVLFYV